MAIREQTGREISSPFENKIVAAGGIPAAKDSRAMIRAYPLLNSCTAQTEITPFKKRGTVRKGYVTYPSDFIGILKF